MKENGFQRERQPRGSHEIWSDGKISVSVPSKLKKRHTANAILKSAGICAKL